MIRDTDRGARSMTLKIKGMASMRLTVGIHDDAAGYQYPNGASLATVATAHEYGLGSVPQRSWLRAWFDGHGRSAFTAEIRGALKDALGGETPTESLHRLGRGYVKEIKTRMDNHIDPELAPETADRKARAGSSTPDTPLEDLHYMRDSIEHEVTLK